MLRIIGLTIALATTLAACGPQRPFVDPALASGVTATNGGGVRSTGNLNSTTLGTGGVGTTNGVNGPGRTY